MSKWSFGCGADDCKYPTYDIFDGNGDNIAREVSYDNAIAIVEAHNKTTANDAGADSTADR